jgi:hypothetical protein
MVLKRWLSLPDDPPESNKETESRSPTENLLWAIPAPRQFQPRPVLPLTLAAYSKILLSLQDFPRQSYLTRSSTRI